MSHIPSLISCDIILPITNYNKFVKLMTDAKSQALWVRHQFLLVLNKMTLEDSTKIKQWIKDNKPYTGLNIKLIEDLNDAEATATDLFSHGINQSKAEFIFLLKEKDRLPLNINRAIHDMYYDEDIDISIAKCETFLEDGTPVEVFPMTNTEDEFFYDIEKGMRLFPSYADPLSALIRRRVFSILPYKNTEVKFKEFSYFDFALRCLNNDVINVNFLPYTLRRAIRTAESAVTITPVLRQKLIEDCKAWSANMPESEYKTFQLDLMELLAKAEITTFKEIDARIEDYLDSNKK